MDIKITFSNYIKSVFVGAVIIVVFVLGIGLISVSGAAPVAIFSLFYFILLIPVLIFSVFIGYPIFNFVMRLLSAKSFIHILVAMLISCFITLLAFTVVFSFLSSSSGEERNILKVMVSFLIAGIPIAFIASYSYDITRKKL